MTPPKYAQAHPAASREVSVTSTAARVETRVQGKGAITPPQFAALLAAWTLEKLSDH